MRLAQSPADTALLSALIFPLLTAAAGSFGCDHIRVEDIGWDLSALGGPKSALHSIDEGASWKNVTYTIDLCRPLRRSGKVAKDQECPNDTRVCGIERVISKEDPASDTILRAIPIAGELKGKGGGDMNAKWERLKTSKSHSDSDKEGLRLEMNGGFSKDEDGNSRKVKAIIEFICDKDRVGDENLWNPEDKYEDGKDKRDEGDDETAPVDDAEFPSLEFLKYDTTGDVDILRLNWRTKHACEDAKQEKDAEKAKHWGFFTWFIIIAFLSTASYLIFGSWLNYNRYGARGWDLVPHSDAIRDVPYLMKDWSRRVLNTVQGGGSRGGYAAV